MDRRGLIGGEQPNAADLQIGSHDPPADEHRRRAPADRSQPAAALARYFPPLVGEVPPGTLPAEWLAAASPAERRRAARAARLSGRPRRQRRPRPPNALVDVERGQRVGRGGSPAGVASAKSSSSAGISTKRRAQQLLVGQRHPLVVQLELAEQQDVDVDRARPVARPPARGRARARAPSRRRAAPAARASVRDAARRRSGSSAGRAPRRRGRCRTSRSRRAPSTPAPGQRVDGGLQVRAALADVGAEAEQPDLATRPASAGGSRRGLSRGSSAGPPAVTFSPITWANGTSPDSGRDQHREVARSARPRRRAAGRSPRARGRRRSARKISAWSPSIVELVRVAEVLERLRRRSPAGG